jgi:hypothetical protein
VTGAQRLPSVVRKYEEKKLIKRILPLGFVLALAAFASFPVLAGASTVSKSFKTVSMGEFCHITNVTKSVSNASPMQGDKITFSVAVTTKDCEGRTVTVKDVMPAGLTQTSSDTVSYTVPATTAGDVDFTDTDGDVNAETGVDADATEDIARAASDSAADAQSDVDNKTIASLQNDEATEDNTKGDADDVADAAALTAAQADLVAAQAVDNSADADSSAEGVVFPVDNEGAASDIDTSTNTVAFTATVAANCNTMIDNTATAKVDQSLVTEVWRVRVHESNNAPVTVACPTPMPTPSTSTTTTVNVNNTTSGATTAATSTPGLPATGMPASTVS